MSGSHATPHPTRDACLLRFGPKPRVEKPTFAPDGGMPFFSSYDELVIDVAMWGAV